LIMDGGSEDGTAQVVEANRDIVRLFLSEPDRGEGHAFNKGLLRARGRYLKLLTDDDTLYPDAVRRAVETLEAHPEIDALVCGGEKFVRDPKTGEDRFLCYGWLPKGLTLTEAMWNSLWPSGFVVCGVGQFLRRSALERVGLLNAACLAIDVDYMARLVENRMEIRFLSVLLYRHVDYPHSQFMNRLQESRRDEVRTLVRLGDWADLFRGFYSGDQILDGARLIRIPHLLRLLVLRVGYGVRRNPIGRIFLGPFRGIQRRCRSLFRPVGSGRPKREEPFNRPVWDGSLR